jgi:CheY-like chemotaxis protein/two-component sensor histidine kinase
MNSVLGFAQLLARKHPRADQQKGLEHILKAGKHLLKLIDEVLDLARIEANRHQLSVEPVHAGTLLEEAIAMIRPLAQEQSVELRENLPEGTDVYVRADRQRLMQVMLNLFSNAVKYNREGGSVELLIALHGTPASEGTLAIGVKDTGPGIPPDRLGELFVPFSRLGAETSGVEGTGLGLALSQRLVEAMGGQIQVESIPGEGSTFWVTLPLDEHPLARLAGERPALPEASEPHSAQAGKTILYVEDNLANLDLVESIFAGRPEIQLLPALQGRLGLDLAKEHNPDLILLDLHLPDIHGEIVLRELQADPKTQGIPVIVVSADATARQIERLRSAGARDYLTKPLDVDQFLNVVDACLLGRPVAAPT